MNIKNKNKIYIQAIELFHEGYIDKAIKKWVSRISDNIKNPSVLNLKGLLYYIKGDLNSAMAVWKLNLENNRNQQAKIYLEDCKYDKEKLAMYNEAEELLKQMHIDAAINILDMCTTSDFNKIRVNLSLAICYLKKGDYSKSSVYLTKVLEIDKKNKLAIKISKQLREYAGIKLEVRKKKVKLAFVLPAIIFLIVAFIGSYFLFTSKIKDEKKENIASSTVVQPYDKKINNNKVKDKENGETTKDTLVNRDEIENQINNLEYDKLYEVVSKYKENNFTGKDKAIYEQAKEILSSDGGINYFYNKGYTLFNNKDYENSNKEFEKVINYGEGNYLFQHALYFCANGEYSLSNNEKAIKYFEEYFNKFKDGTYIEEVTYKLAILYKSEDLDKAKTYAQYLRDNYPSSMYNNDNISNLLK